MRLCYADEHISTELTECSAFLIACWTICLDGATQLEDHHGARQTNGEVPTHTSPSADPETTNTRRYDQNVANLAVDFLREKAASPDDKPFLLYCGFMHPHFPLIAPPEFFSRYDPDTLELPATWNEPLESQHPIIQHHRWAWRNDIPPPEAVVRRALASYYALVSSLDAQVGRILQAIDTTPLRENTLVIYTSDHGEMAGHHGIWQKQCFYEPAVKVPLMLRLPSRETGRVAENVSLVDVLPTLLEAAGLEIPSDLPGDSLLGIARHQANETRRAVFSEYHHMGMLNAGFMLKRGNYKLCHYVGSEPQLFNVNVDPLENDDLASKPEYATIRNEMETALRAVLDPEREDARAKENQRVRRAKGVDSTRPTCVFSLNLAVPIAQTWVFTVDLPNNIGEYLIRIRVFTHVVRYGRTEDE